jgi:hypothetical protein
MKSLLYQILVISVLGISCRNSFGDKELAHDYILYNAEGPALLAHEEGPSIVPPRIFAYSIQKNYILLKIHPNDVASGGIEDSIITRFYVVKILPASGKRQPEDGVIGPIAINTFDSLIKQLGIADPEYETVASH